MKRTPFVRKHKPMRRGKKSAKWDAVRASLKIEFERMGVTRCELCFGTFGLGFAHRMKRRFITDDDELRMVCLLCTSCHEKIEFSGHEAMFEAITAIITSR